jgi:hypothetical protein
MKSGLARIVVSSPLREVRKGKKARKPLLGGGK